MEGSDTVLLKIRLFLSFQMIQTKANRTTLKYLWIVLGIPAIFENWIQWSRSTPGATDKVPNQLSTWYQTLVDILQPKKRWVAVSEVPQSATHIISLYWIMLLRNKLSLVSNLLRRRRHTKRDTLEGINLCQTSLTKFPIHHIIRYSKKAIGPSHGVAMSRVKQPPPTVINIVLRNKVM